MAKNASSDGSTTKKNASPADFGGLRVLSFESRHAPQMQFCIEAHGGRATVVPALREMELHDESVALFEEALRQNRVDVVVFTTGTGVRRLAQQLSQRRSENSDSSDSWLVSLRRVQVVARGLKTQAALRELEIPVALVAPPPHTWRDLLTALDAKLNEIPLNKRAVFLQEYGTPNRALARALSSRGANVSRLLIYQWAMPEDTTALLRAINGVIEGAFDVVLFTNGSQVWHLFKLAYKNGIEDEFREALQRTVVASIGPSCSEALSEFETVPNLQSEQANMKALVEAAAIFAASLRT